ncbi:MAG: DUF5343 domain-containing protein [Candidatus Bipolaricaulota bacterium]|nr:DUF5343 domain-containing protein [Candidatus Bipolaricaulota bacterium]
MANKHPYVTSPGGLVQTVTHFKNSFPVTVNAGTLKKLGFAPNNESYILNVLRFIGLIDQEDKKTVEATKAFSLREDTAFSKAFAALVKAAYSDLFDLHQDGAWDLDADSLITFFRSNDGTTEIVGRRQASTFQLLAAFSGHGDVPEPRTVSATRSKPAKTRKAATPAAEIPAQKGRGLLQKADGGMPVGLSVRIEVNLPADGDQATYDRIFKSIRENLLNG